MKIVVSIIVVLLFFNVIMKRIGRCFELSMNILKDYNKTQILFSQIVNVVFIIIDVILMITALNMIYQ